VCTEQCPSFFYVLLSASGGLAKALAMSNRRPFSTTYCTHRVDLQLLGDHIVIATDSPIIAQMFQDLFGNPYFAPDAQKPATRFYCNIHCEQPWSLAVDAPRETWLLRAIPDRNFQFEEFRYRAEGLERTSKLLSYNGSCEVPAENALDAKLELFTIYFLRKVLFKLLETKPWLRLVHSGALAHDGSGLLLLAPTKGGKSTLTLASVLRGMRFLSDDATPVDLTTSQIMPLPKVAHLRLGARVLVPEFGSLCSGATANRLGERRYSVYPERVRSDAIGEAVKLTHAVRLRGFSERAQLGAISPAEMAVLCTEFDFFATGSEGLDLIWRWGALLNEVSCADLWVGSPMETASLLLEFLEQK
jgi:hypothetical protein